MNKVIITTVIVLILNMTNGKCSAESNETFGCYQCNSHKDDECNYLGQLSDVERSGFYKVCDYEDVGGEVINLTRFCRKMDIYSEFKFSSNSESRVTNET